MANIREEIIRKIREDAVRKIRSLQEEVPLVRSTDKSGDGCNYSDLPLEVQEKIETRRLSEQEYLRYRFSAFMNPFWEKEVNELTADFFDQIRCGHKEEEYIAHLPRHAIQEFLRGVRTYGDLRKRYYGEETPNEGNLDILRRRLNEIRGLGSRTGKNILSLLERVGFFSQDY